jgi:hypothetical protein
MAEETNQVTKALNDAIDANLQAVVVSGVDANGQIYMTSSNSSLPFMHWTLNRSVFELGLFEKNNAESTKKDPESVDPEPEK